MRWWEKTVEYLFVLTISKEQKQRGKRHFFSPLDGALERAGDVIFGNESRMVLIEFKRDANCIKDERRKFLNFDVARADLSKCDAHHLLIYGIEIPASISTLLPALGLEGRTYFSGKRRPVTIDGVFSSGLEHREFSAYLSRLTEYKTHKNFTGTGGVGAGRLNLRDYALVAAIGQDGGSLGCMSVDEFIGRDHDRMLELQAQREAQWEVQRQRGRGYEFEL